MDQQQVLNQQQIQPIQPAIQGNNDAADLARQIQANTNVTMKTEVVKLPAHRRMSNHQRMERHHDVLVLPARSSRSG